MIFADSRETANKITTNFTATDHTSHGAAASEPLVLELSFHCSLTVITWTNRNRLRLLHAQNHKNGCW